MTTGTPDPPPAPEAPKKTHFVTDKIGGPNLRRFDNLFSLGSVLVGIVVGVVMTHNSITFPDPGEEPGGGMYYGLLAVGGVFGFVAGGVLGGLILMVIGLFRRN